MIEDFGEEPWINVRMWVVISGAKNKKQLNHRG